MRVADSASLPSHQPGRGCMVIEYGTIGACDTALVRLNGRYPEDTRQQAINRDVAARVLFLSGNGLVGSSGVVAQLQPGRIVDIAANESYFFSGAMLFLMICSPPWHPEQAELMQT